MKGCILEANLEGQGWKTTLSTNFNLGVEIFLKKRELQKKGALK